MKYFTLEIHRTGFLRNSGTRLKSDEEMQWICLHNLAIHDEKRHFETFLLAASERCWQQNNIQLMRVTFTPTLLNIMHLISNNTDPAITQKNPKQNNGRAKVMLNEGASVIRIWRVTVEETFVVPDYRGWVVMLAEDSASGDGVALWFDVWSTDVSKVHSDDQSAEVSQSPEGKDASESKLSQWMAFWGEKKSN